MKVVVKERRGVVWSVDKTGDKVERTQERGRGGRGVLVESGQSVQHRLESLLGMCGEGGGAPAQWFLWVRVVQVDRV